MLYNKEGYDLSNEEWREYVWICPVTGQSRTYRIYGPSKLWIGSTTHRVQDTTGMVHCIPSVGQLGCALRWSPKDPANPVQF